MIKRLLLITGMLILMNFSSKATLYTVNSNADPGTGAGTTGSLRYCMTQANASAGPHTILFSISATTITITAALPVINQNGIRIDGTGQSVTINGNFQSMFVNSAGIGGLRIKGLILSCPGTPAPIQLNGASASDTIDNNTFNVPTYVPSINLTGTFTNLFINSNIVAQTGDFVLGTGTTITGFTSTGNTNNGVAGGTIGQNYAYKLGTLTNFTISNNTMIRTGGGGTAAIEITTATTGTIASNVLNSFNYGINILTTASSVTCNLNQIVRAAAPTGNIGMYFPAGSGNILTNNVVRYYQTGGVHVSGTNHTITGNKITNCEYGLKLSGASNCTALTDTITNFNNSFGIVITAGSNNNTIGGLGAGRCIVTNGNSDGVRIDGGNNNQIINLLIAANANGNGVHIMNSSRINKVRACLIGVDATGNVASPNGVHGIFLDGSGAANNTIGGTTAADRNIISANGQNGIMLDNNNGPDSTKVLNNYIGVGANGTTVLVNGTGTGHHGIRMNSGSPGCIRNVIKNNVIVTPGRGCGISIESAGEDTISNNYIGVDATGGTLVGVGNSAGEHGLFIKGSALNEYITNNVISGSKGDGIRLDGGTFTNCTMNGNYIGTDATGLVKFFTGTALNTPGIHSNGAGFTTLTLLNNVVAASTSYGIFLDGGTMTNVTIRGNMIGMNKNGLGTTFGNVQAGLYMQPGSATNVVIGGTNVADRNVISMNGRISHSCAAPEQGGGVVLKNSDGVTIQGNYIGVDATGLIAAGNGNSGITLNGGCKNVLVGGIVAGSRNILCSNGYFCTGAGNVRHGVQFVQNSAPTGTMEIYGNYVGLGADGTTMLGNAGEGISSYESPNLFIGGPTPAHRNIVGGNTLGVYLQVGNANGCKVQGNYIGTDVTGTIAKPNVTGVYINSAVGNLIGGPNAGEGNVISGNTGEGILLENADNTIVQQNYIGVQSNGVSPLGNTGNGITIKSGATGILIGSPSNSALKNIIAFNANGVSILDATSQKNAIRRNSIYCNGTARVNGINLNGLGNINISSPGPLVVPTYITAPTPGILLANTPAGDVAGTDVVEVFYDDGCGTCQGKTYLGDASISGTQWSFSPLPAGADCSPKGTASCMSGIKNITATRTDNLGNTSEFMDCDPLPLPAELIAFTAHKYSSDDVLVHWTTASERNNAYFELVRSTNGKTFTPIAKLQGYGNSISLNEYEFVDENLNPGIYYYMLIQVDFDGKQTLSQIITINTGVSSTIEVVPTVLSSGDPVKILNFTGADLLSISLVDMSGKILSENKAATEVESYLSTTGIAPGLYMVKVNTATDQIIEKVLIY